MVPYSGRHSCKMFIRNKPIRFGYKLWALCGSDGYPYHVSIYTGKSNDATAGPLGMRVVQSMVDVVKMHSDSEIHELYCDNFFTSYELMNVLAEQKMKAIGTVRENRTKGACKAMISNKEMKKAARGSYDYRCDGRVYVCKWNDNNIVNIASNFCSHEPVQKVKRRVKRAADLNVTQPFLGKKYNDGMGGVDVMDRLLSSYRPRIRGKKWYFPLITNAINIAVVAAWRLHCAVQEISMSHIEFRQNLTVCLLMMNNHRSKDRFSSDVPSSGALPRDVRRDNMKHTPTLTSQGRCMVCGKNAKHKCKKCNVRLHIERGRPCYETYHNDYVV